MFEFYHVFYAAGILAVQYFFSTRDSLYWGAIIPIGYSSVVIWMLLSNRMETYLDTILIMILGLVFLVAEWHTGRKSLKEKRKKELAKMKSLDMN